MSAEKKTETKKSEQDKKPEKTSKPGNDIPTGFDMYRFMNRWDVILFIAFMVAFLIFTMAIFMAPQPV